MVIPALDAAATVGAAVDSAPPDAEVLVVDGGSVDGTAEAAVRRGARVIGSPPGRAVQMNAGAREAAGDALLFLHADCRLPKGADAEVARLLDAPGVAAGWFPQRIEPDSGIMRWAAGGANRRARWLRLPYGDQAIFTRRTTFERAGGFPEVPIMEDAALARRLARFGTLVPATEPVVTGTAHWERLGPTLTGVLDQATLLLWAAGVPSRRLARWYLRLQRGRSV